MSNPNDGSESYENGQQREEEALAVITEFSEPSNQNAANPPAEVAAEAKENDDKHDNQEQQQPAQPQDPNGGNVDEADRPKQADCETDDNQDKSKLTAEKGEEGVIDADKATPVDASTVLVETQEVVTSSTTNGQQQRKNSSGRIRTGARRASYQTSRSYAGGSFQNYGLTYLPYKSNFEPSEDARRRADEFFKTLKL